MHRVTQIYTVFYLVQLNEAQLQADIRHTDVVVGDIFLSSCSQLFLCRCLFKLVRQIYRAYLLETERALSVYDLLRQRYDNPCVLIVPERENACINCRDILILFDGREVLAVPDCNASVSATICPEPALKSVIGPFAVPVCQDGSVNAAHQRTDGHRFCVLKIARVAYIRNERKRAR